MDVRQVYAHPLGAQTKGRVRGHQLKHTWKHQQIPDQQPHLLPAHVNWRRLQTGLSKKRLVVAAAKHPVYIIHTTLHPVVLQ